eukprot:GHUV01054663.1.p1 GENE.GHUV01054663.1~~GHUV01054663.1.p1  ORF type:complete len:129 (-),score=22.95 GHUV01054663.1:55-441(-)
MHRVQFWQCAVRHHAPLTHIPAPMPCREAPQHPLIQPLVGPAPLHHRPVHLSCLQVEHPRTKQLHRFWFDSPVVGLPINDAAPPGAETRLFPRDCREGVSTSGSTGASATAGSLLCRLFPTPQHIDLL